MSEPHVEPVPASRDLDPVDWTAFRQLAHTVLDDMIDYVVTIRERPVWQPLPDALRQRFRAPPPEGGSPLATVYTEFVRDVLPYTASNVHPGFMGWVQGGGTVEGMLAELLAGALNANCGGRDQAPIEVERQITGWVRDWFGFPPSASGLFVTGASLANFIAVLVARRSTLGASVRTDGLGSDGARLTGYTSGAVHGCVPRAFDYAGLGRTALRHVPTDRAYRIDLDRLRQAIAEDRAAGLRPFMLVGTAGTVDVGAFDDLAALADIAEAEKLWLHVDGALGALGILCPEVAPKLSGIERADSVALDFHKWGQVPYDAGFVLVRDGEIHRDSFAAPADYLQRATHGLAAGEQWPNDYGPDLSRGFRALKTWMTFSVHGTRRLGEMMARTCRIARYLGDRIAAEPELELLAPVSLNIVCFRFRHADADRYNANLVADLHDGGLVAPSSTRIDGRFAIRAAIFNHRTSEADVDRLVDAVLSLGRRA